MKTSHAPCQHRVSRGFTLIEMLLVLVILGILAGIVVPNIANHGQKARVTATAVQIANFKTVLASFELDNGFFPRGQDGLQSLVTAPPDAPNWKGPYVPEIPLDPWGHAYLYHCPGKFNPTAFDIVSMGPDGQLGSNDDISNRPSSSK